MAGIRDRTPISTVLDVLTVIVVDTPGDALKKWRAGMDRAGAALRARQNQQADHVVDPEADRAAMRKQWGLLPGQVEAHRRFLDNMTGGVPSGAHPGRSRGPHHR